MNYISTNQPSVVTAVGVIALLAVIVAIAGCGSDEDLEQAGAPQPTAGSPAAGGWVLSDHVEAFSLTLEAYETGESDEGIARLTVTCFNSPPLGQYISADIAWNAQVSVLYDLSVQLNWDSEDTVFQTWDGTTEGNNVTPRRKQLDQDFIDRLLEHDHLDFAVEGDGGWHRAKFELAGFEAVYGPFKTDCESRPTPGNDYLE